MKEKRLSMFVSDSRVLDFFYGDNKFTITRAISIALLIFTLPVVIIIVCAMDDVFFLKCKPIGLSEDYQFWAFYFCLFPLLLLAFRLVLKRFIYFIDDMPLFCKISCDDHQELVNRIYSMVNEIGRKKYMIALKYAGVIIALSTNFYGLGWSDKRIGAWNCLAHPVELSINMILLVIVLWILVEIAAKYLVILWVEFKVSRQLAHDGAIIVRPMAPDNCGGLKGLGDLSLSFTYFLLPFALTAVASYFTHRHLQLGPTLSLPALIPVFVFVFFAPLSVVHKAMRDAKSETVNRLSKKYQDISQRLMRDIEDGKSYDKLNENKEILEVLDNMYDKARRMPVWPFNTKTLLRFVTVTIIPLSIMFFEVVIKNILEKLNFF